MTGAQVRPDSLPPELSELLATLTGLSGVVGVALGGSRATGEAREGSDWDLAVYYRHTLETAPLAPFGVVHPPGSWGRLMNGGAWLRVGGHEVDVLFRDVDAALHWTAKAEAGEWELDALLGYIAGLPTYSLAAELHTGVTLAGHIPAVGAMPEALRASAPGRWRFCRDFSLEYARMHMRRDNVAGMLGNVARAVTEEAHARACERGLWTLNEKMLLQVTGMQSVQSLFAEALLAGPSASTLLDEVTAALLG